MEKSKFVTSSDSKTATARARNRDCDSRYRALSLSETIVIRLLAGRSVRREQLRYILGEVTTPHGVVMHSVGQVQLVPDASFRQLLRKRLVTLDQRVIATAAQPK